MAPLQQLSIRVDREIHRRFGELAVRTGRSRTFDVEEAIPDDLADFEDLEGTYLGERALDEHRRRRAGDPPRGREVA